jgi:DNA primase large subunit
MPQSFDADAFLNQPIYAWDTLTLLGDIEDFIDFSEANIDWQLKRELRRLKAEHEQVIIDDPSDDAQYKDQEIEGTEYRFSVSLAQRVRYSALTALITSIEWSFLVLRKRAQFAIPDRPEKSTEVVHLLSVFASRVKQDLDAERALLTTLVQVRNCIVHSSGRIETYKYAADLRNRLTGFPGIRLSNVSFLGEGIEIESGCLQGVLEQAKQWLPQLEKALYDGGHVK